MAPFVVWAAERLFGVAVSAAPTGSGDRSFDWVLAFLVLNASVAGALVWSVLDRQRSTYTQLDRWFRAFLRFVLAWELINYGAMKLIPVQMPAPTLTRLLEPYGQFSPMGVLWASIGAAPWYERFVGGVEFVSGLLLVAPRTYLLGVVIACAACVEVLVLNMTYDVPVKLFSFHLVLIALVLISPHLRAFGRVLLARGARTMWAAVLQIAIGGTLAALLLHHAISARRSLETNRPALYGIWDVDVMRIDGVEHPPLVTDLNRWRRIIIENNRRVVFWRMDDTPVFFGAGYQDDRLTIDGGYFRGTFAVTKPDATHLTLEGQMAGRAVRFELTRVDERQFRLMQRDFHWVQEYPVNQ